MIPKVSIIVPCYNEQDTIGLLLKALYKQSYDRNEMEIIIADGLSTDKTREKIISFQKMHPDLTIDVIENEKRTIPAGLNRAIENARGEFIVRLDAHSMPYPDYVSWCVKDLEKQLGDNVGGVWEIRAGDDSLVGRSIAIAASHPLGVGDARYRYSDEAGPVDTVPFGAFTKEVINRVGKFDERLLTNEDYEFNTRIRKSGGTIWLDPRINSVYFSRSSLPELAHQYWRYGYWKVRMLRRYPETIRWRQALPPLFVLSLVVLALLSIWIPGFRMLLIFELIVYLGTLLAVGFSTAWNNRDYRLLLGVPAAIATMHLTWGSAFLWSLASLPFRS